MEPFAAKTVLTSLVTDYELDIATFTTDRSSSMRTLMREPGLSHTLFFFYKNKVYKNGKSNNLMKH